MSYKYKYIDIIGPITLKGFLRERYFLTITDNTDLQIDIYTMKTKSEWAKYIQENYIAAQIKLEVEYLIKRYYTDFNTKLRSGPIERQKREYSIKFKSLALYSQKQNRQVKH